mmetsp:Transcript_44610/g.71704  ORF Transcript_44610/g.71704 Transcript_44610/m.71704 type:complete len:325 (-) Transcript_44610:138-1112(-)
MSFSGPLSEKAKKEEVNCMRLLARCEFQMEKEGLYTSAGKRRLARYLEVLSEKLDTLRKYKSQGISLQFSNKLDLLSTKIDAMKKRIGGERGNGGDNSSSTIFEALAQLAAKYKGKAVEGFASGHHRRKSQKVLLRCSDVPGATIASSSGEKTTERSQEKDNEEPLCHGVLATADERGDDGQEAFRHGTTAKQRRYASNRRRRRRRGRGKIASVSTRLEDERLQQEDLQREILDLSEELKSLQMQVSAFFMKDRKTLDSVTQKMEDNLSRTKSEKKRLDKYASKWSLDICRDWSILAFVATSFLVIYVIIRTFPCKGGSLGTCG